MFTYTVELWLDQKMPVCIRTIESKPAPHNYVGGQELSASGCVAFDTIHPGPYRVTRVEPPKFLRIHCMIRYRNVTKIWIECVEESPLWVPVRGGVRETGQPFMPS